jgi:hypothetical protein
MGHGRRSFTGETGLPHQDVMVEGVGMMITMYFPIKIIVVVKGKCHPNC